jgi:hypothetical protein
MIDNTLGNNDMTGMPGPDMAAPGTRPGEMDPSSGYTTAPSSGINVGGKSLSPMTGNDNAGTFARNTIPKGMYTESYMPSGDSLDKTEEAAAINAAVSNINTNNQIT